MWCVDRIVLGLRYLAALGRLGEMDQAYAAFEDVIIIVVQTMASFEDEFELVCNSPSLKSFALRCRIH